MIENSLYPTFHPCKSGSWGEGLGGGEPFEIFTGYIYVLKIYS